MVRHSPVRVPSGTPAPGFRISGNGTLYNIGFSGFSWSSSIPAGSSHAHNLGFYSGGIYPQNSDYRARALQVRCLQE